MTDQEFQATVLGFIAEQKKFNERQEKVNERQEEFNKKQEEFNKKQEVFNEKLFVVVENDIVERLGGLADEVKVYTDKKIQVHEESYQHSPNFA